MSETDESRGPAPFGVRLDAPTLARLDAYAERAGRKRGWAAARAIAAGLDALEGLPVTAPTVAARVDSPGPVLDVPAMAGALYDLIGPQIADAVAAGVRSGRRPELAAVGVVGVARVVDALRDAYEAARFGAGLDDRAARARLDRAVIDAISALAYGPDGETSTPTPTPAPGASVADGPRLDPASLRSIAGERRQGAPERRKPPRPDDSGRRLADALRAARSARTLTQRDAARAAGVSVATYQRAESGADMAAHTRARLAGWAGVEL